MKSGVKILAKALTGGFALTNYRDLYEIIHPSFDLVSVVYSLEENWGKVYCGAFCLARGEACLCLHLRAVFVSLSKPTEIKQLLCFSTQIPDILIIIVQVK